MWYDEAAKKLYTIGLFNGRPLDDTPKSTGFLISSFLHKINEHTRDLCLDSAAAGNRTLHLMSMLVALFAMRLAIAKL